MNWTAISGSWRHTNAQVEADVRGDVARILGRGDGIVTGGALGVDYIAADEALRRDPACQQLRIIIPTPLAVYAAHYRNRGVEGVISPRQAMDLIEQLGRVKRANRNALTEMGHKLCNEATYHDRNTQVVNVSNQLFAYQVNGSPGTQDTIDKARRRGIPVTHRQYQIS